MYTRHKLVFYLLCSVICFINIHAQPITRFAVIGDYGSDGPDELAVASLVKGWDPDFIVTTGDNNYRYGEASTIDANIGKYYHDFIKPYLGTYGNGSPDSNRFYPVPGNHDWDAPELQPYLDYFTLPNNERYYDFVWGELHFFMIDADEREPDGYSSSSSQALWIKDKMESSTSKWKIVLLHYSPYSSALTHGSVSTVQWPYKLWGADAVISAHDHTYERLIVDNLTYFVNGLGGRSLRIDDFPIDSTLWEIGSQVRFSADYGAMLVEVFNDSINCKFITKTGLLIDDYSIVKGTSSLEEELGIIKDFNLFQNYPNPFNPSTAISWQLSSASRVNLKIFNMLGEEIATLVDEYQDEGNHSALFSINQAHLPEGFDLPSGVYLYRLQAGTFCDTKKMLLMK